MVTFAVFTRRSGGQLLLGDDEATRAAVPAHPQLVWMAARRAAMWIRSQTPENGGA